MRLWVMAVSLAFLAGDGLAAETSTAIYNDTSSHWTSGISANVSGGYRWGSYSAPGQAQDAQGGMGLLLFGGYRFRSDLELGLGADFAFPQIQIPEATSDADFSYRSLSVQLGYLWRNKIKPFIHYSPLARLSQSSSSRLGTARVQTDITYEGQAFGVGTEIYLTERSARSVQMGLKFAYIREIYSRVNHSSEIEAVGERPAPAFTPANHTGAGLRTISGNTYQMGVFVGI